MKISRFAPSAWRGLSTASCLILAGGILLGSSTAATGQEASPGKKVESARPEDAFPQVQRSLQLELKALELVTNQPTKETLLEAAHLCITAYRLQRGSQSGFGFDRIKRHSPLVAEAQKHIKVSRDALLGCTTRFNSAASHRKEEAIEQGLEFLRTAITRTRVAITLAE
jgi:hypothetical protein